MVESSNLLQKGQNPDPAIVIYKLYKYAFIIYNIDCFNEKLNNLKCNILPRPSYISYQN